MIISASQAKFRDALAASALALGVVISAAPANAVTVTDNISFTDTGTYDALFPNCGCYAYNPSGQATASFTITFDPTKLYLDQPLAGFVTGLSFSVTDSFFQPPTYTTPLTFDPITAFTYSPGGTLQLFSLVNSFGGGALPAGTPDITISINGFGSTPGSSVYYSQNGFPDTLTTNGDVSIATTPLPSTWTMLIASFFGLGFFAYRGSKRNAAALAAA